MKDVLCRKLEQEALVSFGLLGPFFVSDFGIGQRRKFPGFELVAIGISGFLDEPKGESRCCKTNIDKIPSSEFCE